MTRPMFALTIIHTSYEFEGGYRYAGTVSKVHSRRYFQTEAGAQAAYRLGGHAEWDDGECYARIDKLQPGTVYDQEHGWVDGEAYQPWHGERPATADAWDEMPF